MYCPDCGQKVEDSHHYCYRCGFKLPELSDPEETPVPIPDEPVPAPTKPEVIPVAAEETAPEPEVSDPAPEEPAPTPKRGRIWPPIAAMAVLACLGLALFFFGPKAEQPYLTVTDGAVTFHSEYYTGGPELTIPAEIDGQTVTAIADGGFRDCGLESVILPDTVTRIGSEAFANCDYLRGIYVPPSVTEIGTSAFEDCDALEAIYVPGTMEGIGENALSACDVLKYILFNGTYDQWRKLYDGKFASRVELHATDGTYYTHP